MKTPAKLFISYSHRDEEYHNDLIEHLSLLKRNGSIEAWSDRKILAGENWKDEIDDNLENAQIVLFLVSPSFIASNYCYEIEAKRALEKNTAGETIVVPILVRPCLWKDSPFAKLQALPKDAKAISTHDNKDEAWLDVISGLKSLLDSIPQNTAEPITQTTLWSEGLTPKHKEWLEDTEIKLTHRRATKVNLTDIFVAPDLLLLEPETKDHARTISSTAIPKTPGHRLIYGDEQSGKTTLAKFFYTAMREAGWDPVYIEGGKIRTSDITELWNIENKIQKTKQASADNSKRCIIIDDYHLIPLNKKYQSTLLQKIHSTFETSIIFAIDAFQYVAPDYPELEAFTPLEVRPFNNVLRSKLIEKWVSLGVSQEIPEQKLYSEIDTLKTHIDSIIRKNIVPPKPVFILILLQTFEAITPQRIELTSYGHCYQHLIYQSLEKCRIKTSELDSYLNVLTEFAYYLFSNKKDSASDSDIEEFLGSYHNSYLDSNTRKTIDDLSSAHILEKQNEQLRFKYRYIYFFYVAKYLAENLREDHIKKEVQGLFDTLHREDSSNIIIFVTHHTKDSWILDELQICLMDLFHEENPACLKNEDLTFIGDVIHDIPKLVLEQREVEKEREDKNAMLDESERLQSELDKQTDELEPNDLLATINRTFKGIEIAGQIIRNRYGSLSKDNLKDIIENAFGSGLRFLQYFLHLSDSHKGDVIQNIEHILKDNPGATNDEITKQAKDAFILLTYGVIFGVLKKISSSIGSTEARQIYKEIEEDRESPAMSLVNLSIELNFHKNIDYKKLEKLKADLTKNPVCARIMKEFVLQHIYMNVVEYKDKQRISSLLNIPVQQQNSAKLQQKLGI